MIDESKIKWGYRADLEDNIGLAEGSQVFMLGAPVDPPDEIDLRGWLKIENQSQLGSCAGHMQSSILELCNWVATKGGIVQLSRMFSYLTGQKACGLLGSDQGCTISGVMDAAKETGICQEQTFPYTGRYETAIPKAAYDEAKPHTLGAYSMLSDERACFNFLASGVGGIGVGMTCRKSYFECTGVLEQSTGRASGGHAIPIVGYSKRKDSQGRNYYWSPGSWSESWGNKGWAEIAPVVVDQWFDEGAAIFGASDLKHFGYRPIKSWSEMFG